MIWVIIESEGDITITSNKDKVMLHVEAKIENGETFKVIPYDEKKGDLRYYAF